MHIGYVIRQLKSSIVHSEYHIVGLVLGHGADIQQLGRCDLQQGLRSNVCTKRAGAFRRARLPGVLSFHFLMEFFHSFFYVFCWCTITLFQWMRACIFAFVLLYRTVELY
jgi:hypothetical protein